MKIAIPCSDGKLCMHFGHCEEFVVTTVDQGTGSMDKQEKLTPPPHEPGLLPRWLAEKGVEMIIAGGMGQRAQKIFESNDIKVVVGAQPGCPTALIKDYLCGTLTTGTNTCDH